MTIEGEVYFAMYGDDFDPDEVTRLVGLKPTSTKRKGNPTPKHTSWKLSTGKIEHELVDVYEMSSSLVSKLKPYADRINEAKRQLGLEASLEIVLWITTDDTISTPTIGFDQEVISFLHAVGATIDVDTYRNAP